jgi:uncharacterized protein RhaS with RHS repeats
MHPSRAVALWLSRDPIGLAGGINLYCYVENNPVNTWDPFGLVEQLDPSSVKALRGFFRGYNSEDIKAVPTSELEKAARNARAAAKKFDDDINKGDGCDKKYDATKHRDLQNKRADALQKEIDQRQSGENPQMYLHLAPQITVAPGLLNPGFPGLPVEGPIMLGDPIFLL